MKTTVVELDAGGRGCHGHRSLLRFVDGCGWVRLGVGWMLATARAGRRRLSREKNGA
jgi:hypothetical protein